MKYLSFRNRIAFNYIAVTALLIAVLFVSIYMVIYQTVYDHLDTDLDAEIQEVYSSIVVLDNTIVYANPNEWNEKEHGLIEVNPTFVAIVDTLGNVLRKTPNLRDGSLTFSETRRGKTNYDTLLSGAPIRQLQTPIQNPTGRTLAFLIIAIPLQESIIVLKNLRQTLLIGYPIVLFFLFFISRFIVGRSIAPIDTVIATAQRITKENLDERIILPENKDEIYTLTETINNLLDRLRDVVVREKQFTADASHELRTPLAVMKGTLEVLVRKPREPEQYVEKIRDVTHEVDRMSHVVDQLLELARYESGSVKPSVIMFELNTVISDCIGRLTPAAEERSISLLFSPEGPCSVRADVTMTAIIIENILSNAIKYSPEQGSVNVTLEIRSGAVVCSISDQGIGLTEDQIAKIFDRFYRVDESRASNIEGKGIGLAIVKRLIDIQHCSLFVQSTPASGTTFIISFPI
ncbi:MAG: sensor histidine kinase [Bacteroidota bacterium]